MRYLDTETVGNVLDELDVVGIVADGLRAHAAGDTVLPAEAYLRWDVAGGGWARSLSLPAAIGRPPTAAGVKIINGNPDNPGRGLPRAQGLYLGLDPVTARVHTVMAAAGLSATRTAAVTALAVGRLAPRPPQRVAVIGAGPIGVAHLRVLHRALDGRAAFTVYDAVGERARAVAAALADRIPLTASASLAAALAGCEVVVAATTSDRPYLGLADIAPGTFVANVGLDDCDDELVLGADLLVVDDWGLIADDRYRTLGRLHHAGRLAGPSGPPGGDVRRVDAELPALVAGSTVLTATADHRVVLNPFGMAIHDVALGAAVCAAAERAGLGLLLPD